MTEAPQANTNGESQHPTGQNQPETQNKGIPPWRWAWMGFGLAVVLWFGSSIYFQKAHQLTEIEYQAGGMELSEYEASTKAGIRASMYCKIGAGILCLATLTYLISQIDIHRPRNAP